MPKKSTGTSSKWDCPICGQYMDFHVVHFRNKPFIDGKLYQRMCFCCANVPLEYIQHYTEDGSIDHEEGPFFDCQHLSKPEDLYMQSTAESVAQARKCVLGVKKKIAEAGGIRVLSKQKFTRPKSEYDTNPEAEELNRANWAIERKKK